MSRVTESSTSRIDRVLISIVFIMLALPASAGCRTDQKDCRGLVTFRNVSTTGAMRYCRVVTSGGTVSNFSIADEAPPVTVSVQTGDKYWCEYGKQVPNDSPLMWITTD
jgi:hypothetical protein